MLEVQYRDAERKVLECSSSDFPAEIEEVHIDVKFEDCSSEFANLSNILNQKLGKIQEIHIYGVGHISITAEFLAFFLLVSRKARRLSLSEVLLNDGVCTLLVAAIVDPDALSELEIQRNEVSLPDDLMGRLFDAISHSSSLEDFSLFQYFPISMEVSSSIATGLRGNRSLKSFKLFVEGFPNSAAVEGIVSAALTGERLETLEISDPTPVKLPLPLSTLVLGLCREDSNLRSIDISFDITVDMDLTNNIVAMNSSLQSLCLRYANLTPCTQCVEFAMLFRSLQVLNIGQNNPISDLRPLSALLLGENSMLQRLAISVGGRVVDDEEWFAFCEVVARTKSVRSLGIGYQLLESLSEPQSIGLLEALWQNTSLESLQVINKLVLFEDWPQGDLETLFSKMSTPLSFNRAGRRALQNWPSDQPLAQGLWPLVLERATKLDYYAVKDNWKSPSLSSRRPDAVYWLLREIMIV